LCLASLYAYVIYKGINSAGRFENATLVEVTKQESVTSLSQKLSELNILDNQNYFQYGARIYLSELKPGYYEILPKSSIKDILLLFESGKTKVVKLTFPEGWRAEQIAARLDQNGVVAYEQFLVEAKAYEGKLFPDTYFFQPKMSAKEVVAMMLADFQNRTSGLVVTNEDLIIASLVEREAAKDEERPLIAGIYKNRLKQGMKLQADPTVQYGKDTNEIAKLRLLDSLIGFKYWKPITLADYQGVKSDYNTYRILALPPRPIANPGLKSIEATINYEHHKYLFFLQSDGKIYPSETSAQHDYYRRKMLGAKN